jgi:hypothetical protein
MKLVVIISTVVAVCAVLLILYYTPAKLPFYPFEETSPGLMVRVPNARVPEALDRVEAVLREQKIPYRRVDARTLYFDLSKEPMKVIEIERRAGLRKT